MKRDDDNEAHLLNKERTNFEDRLKSEIILDLIWHCK